MTVDSKGKVVEIFKSQQGEGKYVGLPQIFLRMSHCNLQCTYCDTDFNTGAWMSVGEVVQAVENLLSANPEVRSVSVTGGEPLLQVDFLTEVLPVLRCKASILLETNGTIPSGLRQLIEYIDIVSMDIKLASASLTEAMWHEHGQFLEAGKGKDLYVKVVLSAQTVDEDFRKAVEMVAATDAHMCFILQPVTPLGQATLPSPAQMEKWSDIATRSLADVRVIPQMHKRWGIP